jgi:ribosomal protein S18 acetylase RimI-like enzyme
MIQKIGPSSAKLAAPLFDQYRMFYGQVSDLALAERYLYERLSLGESVVFLAFGGASASPSVAAAPVGFAQLYPMLSSISAAKNWLLNDLFVDPAYRGQSVGKELLQEVFAFALEQGATSVTLETGVNNLVAQGLYEQLGFVRQEPETEFYVYKKTISSYP